MRLVGHARSAARFERPDLLAAEEHRHPEACRAGLGVRGGLRGTLWGRPVVPEVLTARWPGRWGPPAGKARQGRAAPRCAKASQLRQAQQRAARAVCGGAGRGQQSDSQPTVSIPVTSAALPVAGCLDRDPRSSSTIPHQANGGRNSRDVTAVHSIWRRASPNRVGAPAPHQALIATTKRGRFSAEEGHHINGPAPEGSKGAAGPRRWRC